MNNPGWTYDPGSSRLKNAQGNNLTVLMVERAVELAGGQILACEVVTNPGDPRIIAVRMLLERQSDVMRFRYEVSQTKPSGSVERIVWWA